VAASRASPVAAEARLNPDDRRLSALLAAFLPERAIDLASLLGGAPGEEVRAAVAGLLRAGRSARLAELACSLAPAEPAMASRLMASPAEDGTPAEAAGPAGRLRRRFRLELLST
jgi:hypothetical protein